MKMLVRTLAPNLKKVLQIGEYELGKTYQLTNGCHSGRLIVLNHISYHAQIVVNGERQRSISGVLVGETTKINATLEQLQQVV